jgi:multicomponent Na+:H+ antiporter subunit F
MTGLELPVALFLLANLAAALLRAARGPTAADRMLAALLFGSTGVGVLALLAHAGGGTPLIDVALTLALLAAITGVAFARRAWRAGQPPTKGDDDAPVA